MTRPLLAIMLAAAWPVDSALAAGGHFDVDDAVLIDAQHCQVETWALRAAGGATGLHLGPACRIGSIELGLNLDRLSGTGETVLLVGPQVKWAVAVWPDRLAVGLAWAAARDARRGGRPLHTLYAPASVTLDDRWTLNLNLGLDRDDSGARLRRVGASAEWSAAPRLTLLVERGRFGGAWTSRAGARWALHDTASIDVGIARVGAPAARVLGLGFNQSFAR